MSESDSFSEIENKVLDFLKEKKTSKKLKIWVTTYEVSGFIKKPYQETFQILQVLFKKDALDVQRFLNKTNWAIKNNS